ncbi:MAG: hypothetical protein ACI4UV_04395 [Victivallales bacterium]
MKQPEITQANVRFLLPAKIAATVALIGKNRHCFPLDALMIFYKSATYAKLEREETKFWWLSPLQLYREFCQEQEILQRENQKNI